MTNTITLSVSLVPFTCDACGATTGVPWAFHQRWEAGDMERCRLIYCACCGQKWNCGETLAQKLEKELARERAAHDQTRASRDRQIEYGHRMERRVAATRGVVTKIKNRVGNGVCPCCTRSFQNLRRHMETKHPGWKGEDPEPTT